MKIERADTVDACQPCFKDLRPGDCFQQENETSKELGQPQYYIKQALRDRAVNLLTGDHRAVRSHERVLLVDAKVVIK